MKIQNQTNSLIYSNTFNNTPSLIITPPATTTTILIVLSKIKNSSNNVLLARTAPSSGIFATSGYLGATYFVRYNSNAWSNIPKTDAFIISGSTNSYADSNVYISGFNTSYSTSCWGEGVENATDIFMDMTVGVSPTTSTISIQILPNAGGVITSGRIKIYSM